MGYPKPKLYRICLFKTALWWAGNIVAGLAPLWILFLIWIPHVSAKASEVINKEYINLISSGVITFFFLATTGSIAVDLYLERATFENKDFPTRGIFVAIGIGFIVSLWYAAYVFLGDGKTHFGDNISMTIIINSLAFTFCAVGKYSLILKDLK